MFRLALLFLILIVYGSLYPFDHWTPATAPLFSFLYHWPEKYPGADLVQNVLAYAPFGLFLTLHVLRRRSTGMLRASAPVLAAGFVLSLTMESLQQFEPARTASSADIAMNVFGTAAGALLAMGFMAAPQLHLLQRLHRWRERRFHAGTLPNIGLAALALWVLAQTSPLVPALDLADLGRKLVFLAWQLRHATQFAVAPMLVVAAQLAALGMLLRTLRPRAGAGQGDGGERMLLVLLAGVFAARLLVYGRHLSLYDLAGAALALLVLRVLRSAQGRRAVLPGGALLLAGFVLGELLPGYGRHLHAFNWVPLSGQMRSLAGLENILELFWPFFALAYFARWLTPPHRRFQVQWQGALLVLALVFQLEWMQQAVPGRYGDITQVLLAVCGWLLPFSFRGGDMRLSRAAGQAGGGAIEPASSVSSS